MDQSQVYTQLSRCSEVKLECTVKIMQEEITNIRSGGVGRQSPNHYQRWGRDGHQQQIIQMREKYPDGQRQYTEQSPSLPPAKQWHETMRNSWQIKTRTLSNAGRGRER